MDAFLVSTGAVALAEIGDKTQLLAFILAARFNKPMAIILGIFLATLINHTLAGLIGLWISTLVSPQTLRWILAFSFLIMAAWIILPDTMDQEKKINVSYFGVFGATFLTFFLAEMGDKTQIATVILSAHYKSPIQVIAGTTAGMLLADVPVVFIGNKLSNKIPIHWIRFVAGGIFLTLALLSLLI
ncbi:MAG TPA: TMEM165/GDT1 family protein [Legionella sp.]|nr:TMEM165/GDT1 family protein [Legionella sp.]